MICCENQTLRKSVHSSLSEEILTFYLRTFPKKFNEEIGSLPQTQIF